MFLCHKETCVLVSQEDLFSFVARTHVSFLRLWVGGLRSACMVLYVAAQSLFLQIYLHMTSMQVPAGYACSGFKFMQEHLRSTCMEH